jgi:putative ABC transport system permease protein
MPHSWRPWKRIFRLEPGREVDEELRFHVEKRIADYMERGMTPEEARQAAAERLGDLAPVRSECTVLLTADRRTIERRRSVNVSWLDVKLSVRMLVKYPGLSFVSVIGMALAIAIGAGSFAAISSMLHPTLPLDEGERVVALQKYGAGEEPDRQVIHEFADWREGLRSIRNLGAFRTVFRNLISTDGSTELARVAEMSASGFRVARVAPLFGRPLVDDDERAGAPRVLVIAYEEWQRRFESDPAILGRTVRLNGEVHTVVGVMPEGCRFPIQHRYWIPLRLNALDYARGGGPELEVFGRLADGATIEQAQAELSALTARIAAQLPDPNARLRSVIVPFTHPYFDLDSPITQWWLRLIQIVVTLLLVVVSVNVAVLVYARTATRAGEISVRSALGASRRRVVAQLFMEAIVLSLVAAVMGLAMAAASLGWLQELSMRMDGDELPFWWKLELSAGLVIYVVALAVMAGVIVGVVPALKATGRRVQEGLQQFSSRSSQMQLGRTWTALIVVQVAIAVAILPGAVHHSTSSFVSANDDPRYAREEIFTADVGLAREATPGDAELDAFQKAHNARFRERGAALIRRLEAEPGIAVTFSSNSLGSGETLRVETDRSRSRADNTSPDQEPAHHEVLINQIDVDLFEVFGVPMLAGRGFNDADTWAGSTAVIVNRTFAERVLGGGNVLGRRIRATTGDDNSAQAASRWFEVVGVVPDFPAPKGYNPARAYVYQPVSAGQIQSLALAVRTTGGAAASFANRLRDIAATVDPGLQLHWLRSTAAANREVNRFLRMAALAIVAVTVSVMLLSAAGIYAMMSFIVAKRRRDIGICAALGADPRRLLRGIFARASYQLGTGVVIGLILAVALDQALSGIVMRGQTLIVLPIVSVLFVVLGLLAALGPARRGLAVQPTEALRSE